MRTASTDKISELVIFIDNLVYNDGSAAAVSADAGGDNDEAAATTTTPTAAFSQKELETAKVLLVSLALVHAARSGIWYGMMESPKHLVSFYSKYFRMSDVSTKESSSDEAAMIPLVLDIKKCHFKYAILLLEETLRMMAMSNNKPKLGSDALCSERMMVNLSFIGGTNGANTTQDAARARPVFCNSLAKDIESKKAHVRLVKHPDNKAELFSVMASTNEEGQPVEALNPLNSLYRVEASANWNVIRSFPLVGGATKNEAEKNDESVESSDDIFLTELKKKQSKLLELESSVETTSRSILAKAYDEHLDFRSDEQRAKRERDKAKVEEYNAVQKRIHEAELAWQAQLDQDMDAVCDVCFDGEVTPDNQIIFCDACNVAIHQRCYGIDQIPTGNYFCHTCTHFEIDKEYLAAKRRNGPPLKISRPPIHCELCPKRQGAFVQVQTLVQEKKPRWVHVGCAKWQGMNYVDVEAKDKIEDLTALKNHFRVQGIKCTLCKSGIGALHQCRVDGCDKWLHLTCARAVGKCSVQHGENCEGYHDPTTLDNPPWTLACPKHSEVDPESVPDGRITAEQLVAIASTYPPEPVPPKPFYKMNAGERKEYWSDPDNLAEFFEKVMTSIEGAKCSVCELVVDQNIDKRCDKCGVLTHADCADPARGDSATCLVCRFKEESAKSLRVEEEPRCHMCSHSNSSGGALVRATAKPVSMGKWKKGTQAAFQNSHFGKNKFVHALCGM